MRFTHRFQVNIVGIFDNKTLNKLKAKIRSINHVLSYYGSDTFSLNLEYPSHKSAVLACRNFSRNPKIIKVSLQTDIDFK